MKATRRSAVQALALLVLVAAATFPAWRLLLLGDGATVDELLQLRCGATAAKPSQP